MSLGLALALTGAVACRAAVPPPPPAVPAAVVMTTASLRAPEAAVPQAPSAPAPALAHKAPQVHKHAPSGEPRQHAPSTKSTQERNPTVLNHVGAGTHEFVSAGGQIGKNVGKTAVKAGKGIGHFFAGVGHQLKDGWDSTSHKK